MKSLILGGYSLRVEKEGRITIHKREEKKASNEHSEHEAYGGTLLSLVPLWQGRRRGK